MIDDVKASTSDIPTIHVNKSITPQSESPFSDSGHESGNTTDHSVPDKPLNQLSQSQTSYLGISQPQTFYASEDNNLKLSGVGVFSPAASLPASPTLSRGSLQPEGRSFGREMDEGLQLRQRAKQVPPGVIASQD